MKDNFSYAIFPLQMLTDEKYKHFSCKEHFLYMLLLNRANISKTNFKHFSDKNGFFVYYSNEQITKHLKCSKDTATQVLRNLENAGLIRKEYQKRGLPLKIYVNDIRGIPPTPITQEKPVSFDTQKAIQQSRDNRIDFGTKKNKRRTRY